MPVGLLIGVAALLGVAIGWLAVPLLLALLGLTMLVRRSRPMVAIALILVASSVGAMRSTETTSLSSHALLNESRAAMGTVASIPLAGSRTDRVELEVSHLQPPRGAWRPAQARVLVMLPPGADVSVGDRIYVEWQVEDAAMIDPGFGAYLHGRGDLAVGRATFVDVRSRGPVYLRWLVDVRRWLVHRIQELLPGDAGSLAAGIVTGDDSTLSQPVQEAFRATGTGHITAVSGQNVSLLLVLITRLFGRGSRRWRQIQALVALVVIWSYVGMVGAEPPSIRAACVSTLVLGSGLVGISADLLTVLSLTLGGMAIVDPWITHQVGFWMSAAASAALCSVVDLDATRRWQSKVQSIAIGSIVAGMATLPFVAVTFSRWSPISPLANMVISIPVGIAFGSAYVLASLSWLPDPVLSPLAFALGLPLRVVIWLVRALAHIAPESRFPAGDGVVGLLLGIPCFLTVAAFSRDAWRWARYIDRIRGMSADQFWRGARQRRP